MPFDMEFNTFRMMSNRCWPYHMPEISKWLYTIWRDIDLIGTRSANLKQMLTSSVYCWNCFALLSSSTQRYSDVHTQTLYVFTNDRSNFNPVYLNCKLTYDLLAYDTQPLIVTTARSLLIYSNSREIAFINHKSSIVRYNL